jgi:thiol-disulfide isomerase/thioredoxin
MWKVRLSVAFLLTALLWASPATSLGCHHRLQTVKPRWGKESGQAASTMWMQSTSPSAAVQALVLAALVALNAAAAAPSRALPPMNCNSFGCYPVGVNPGGGTARAAGTKDLTTTAMAPNSADVADDADSDASAAPTPATLGRPPPVAADSTPRALKTARALRRNKAVMYGAYWCGFCNRERQELGREAMAMVEYVECDARGEGGDPNRCADADVSAFPTWVLANGKRSEGARGLTGLEGLVGLPPPRPPLTIPNRPPPIDSDSSPRALEVAAALKEKRAVMYGAYWCGFCNRERQELGREAMAMVEYVECDARGEGADAKRCADADVSAFPTWVLPDGARREGALGIEGLAKWATK